MKFLIVDTRQKTDKHIMKHDMLKKLGYTLIFKKLNYGDYALHEGGLSVDTKQDIAELWQNLTSGHKRFRAECIRAAQAGGALVILIENKYNIKDLRDLKRWIEPTWAFRKRKYAKRQIIGCMVEQQCKTMQCRYGVVFAFCHPRNTAACIDYLLRHEKEFIAEAQRIACKNGVVASD